MGNKIEIANLGSKGDGVTENGRFIPFTLPGEIVEINDTGAAEIITPSPDRIGPICRHFGTCGGCSLQHLQQDKYLEWKRQQVINAFDDHGLNPDVGNCLPVALGTRRRATFSSKLQPDGLAFGFQARKSHAIIDLEECPVLGAPISDKFGQMRQLAKLVSSKSESLRISILACDNGLDVTLEVAGSISDNQHSELVQWAVNARIARLSCNDEVILQTAHPIIAVAGASISPSPGSFVQAVPSSEQRLVDVACGHLKTCSTVLDLFSGFGTFALALAKNSTVHAVEFDNNALADLNRAAGKISGIKQVTTEHRDLLRRPLQVAELNNYDGLIFDPPRAGAEQQAKELTASNVQKIAAISCNPTTLARDVRILADGGYTIKKVVPLDQFLYSHHVEVVALLERKKIKVKRKIFG